MRGITITITIIVYTITITITASPSPPLLPPPPLPTITPDRWVMERPLAPHPARPPQNWRKATGRWAWMELPWSHLGIKIQSEIPMTDVSLDSSRLHIIRAFVFALLGPPPVSRRTKSTFVLPYLRTFRTMVSGGGRWPRWR